MKRIDYIADGGAVIFTALQTEQIFQYISLALTILSILVSLGYTFYKWYEDAKKDGKITKKEINDLKEKTTEDVEKLKETINKEKEK